MNFHKFAAYILAIIMLLGVISFTACDSNDKYGSINDRSDSASENSDIPSDENSSNHDDNRKSDNESIKFARETFNITLPIVTAGEALDIVKMDLPAQIDGSLVHWGELIDEDLFIVDLLDKRESGLYNIKSHEYSPLPGIGIDNDLCAYNRNHIVFKRYDGDFTVHSDDDSVKLYLYDISNKTYSMIYEYSFDRYIELYYHWTNGIVLTDNIIYFDDISEGDDAQLHAYIYSYDIQSGKVEKILDDAQNPFMFNGDILYFKLKGDRYEHISSLNGKYDLDINGDVSYLAALSDSFYSLGVFSNDNEKRVTTWGIRDLVTNEYFLITNRTISFLFHGDSFLAFSDYGIHGYPIVYNAQDRNIIVFDGFYDASVYWRFYRDIGIIGVIGDSPELYMFKLKKFSA